MAEVERCLRGPLVFLPSPAAEANVQRAGSEHSGAGQMALGCRCGGTRGENIPLPSASRRARQQRRRQLWRTRGLLSRNPFSGCFRSRALPRCCQLGNNAAHYSVSQFSLCIFSRLLFQEPRLYCCGNADREAAVGRVRSHGCHFQNRHPTHQPPAALSHIRTLPGLPKADLCGSQAQTLC